MTGATVAAADGTSAWRWSHPRQRMLVLLAAGVIVGSFMPWLETGLGTYRGFAGPGRYLFYAGVLGLGAGLVPVRALAIAQGAVLAAVAIFLPLWQVVRLLNLVGVSGWAPGLGMVLIFGCGVMAARVTISLVRQPTG